MTEAVPLRFAAAMERITGGRDVPLGIAVSGGGDSVALMHLAARRGGRLRVATVDHGLRDGSDREAEAVCLAAAALGLPHDTLRWTWDGAGNLQAAARDARRSLMSEWAAAHGLAGVLAGHTLDDQAETVVLRLARGSGVEGLSGMAEGRLGEGAPLRPLLGIGRGALRDWLAAQGIGWTEDPSNDDERFDRVRARKAIAALGLDPVRLAATAARMSRARVALERRAFEAASALVRPGLPGEVQLDRGGLLALEEDTLRRILAGALRCVAGAAYRPSEDGTGRLVENVRSGGVRTLMGCVMRAAEGRVVIHREPAAVADLAPGADGVWDGAWRAPDAPDGCDLRALGSAGLLQLAATPEAAGGDVETAFAALPENYPRAALAAKPALWRAGRVAGFAPLGWGVPHRLIWSPPGGTFPDALLTRS